MFGYFLVLVVPFKTNMIAKRVRDNPDHEELERMLIEYNKGLSSGRIDIEHTFGLLKVCFSFLLFSISMEFFKDVGARLDHISTNLSKHLFPAYGQKLGKGIFGILGTSPF